MNTLERDFNEFVSHRLDYLEANSPVSQTNECADSLKRNLKPAQLRLFNNALDFKNETGSILEENAYKQGLIDALQLMGILRECL